MIMYKEFFFPTTTPEGAGIPSTAVQDFISGLENAGLCMHAFAMMRHGKVFAEGYYKPFHSGSMHRMYSASKSFVSIAIGLLCGEGKISLNDRAISFFPDKAPQYPHPFSKLATIRDLLMMASPHKSTTYGRRSNPDSDWVRTFFTAEPSHMPGHIFSYDTSATVTLNAIVERVTGMPFLDYIRKEALDETGFSNDAFCIRSPDNAVSWGGSGVVCTLRDLTRFGELAHRMGSWMGRQVIDREYMIAATSKQIKSYLLMREGYGYHFARLSGNGFGAIGLGGQIAACYPDYGLVLATMADTQPNYNGIQLILELFSRHIIGNAENTSLNENPAAVEALSDHLKRLEVNTVEGQYSSPISDRLSGKTFRMIKSGGEGALAFKTVRFYFSSNSGVMRFADDDGEKEICFGFGRFENQDFPGYASAQEMYGKPVLAYGFDQDVAMHLPCIISAAWVGERNLLIQCHAIGDFLGTLRIEVTFGDDCVTLSMAKFAERFWNQYQGLQSGILEDR